MVEDLINKNVEQAVKVGPKTDESKQSNGLDYMKESSYKPESAYFQYNIGEFSKLWITIKQPTTEGAFQPKIEPMLNENKEPVFNEYKDSTGKVINKVPVRKATWQVLNIDGKSKIFGVTVGGGKSLFAKINTRIVEAFKSGKKVLGLKIKKSGSGMTTTYDIETNNEPMEVK